MILDTMALVLAECKDSELVMVGGGEQERELIQLAESLNISSHIMFEGPKPHEEVPSILRQTDIFAMPSIYENESLGVAALEAQAMAVPVVATNVGGIPEAVINGVTGILVEPKNERQLAAAILRLINDPGLRIQMGTAGRQHVLKNFDWNTNVLAMEKLYIEIQRGLNG